MITQLRRKGIQFIGLSETIYFTYQCGAAVLLPIATFSALRNSTGCSTDSSGMKLCAATQTN